MVFRSWDYRTQNWIYVVLSRVRTSEGLFICEKLRDAINFAVDPRLIQEEEHLRTK